MNYRDEQTHDWLLIGLIEELNSIGQLNILSKAFGVDNLTQLERAQRRQPFDIELTFSNLSLIIETKVDSDEGGRWNQAWQTNRIVESANSVNYLKDEKVFLFITYGTSEFYTKPYNTGAASQEFRNVGLDAMIELMESALKFPLQRKDDYQQWLKLMYIEKDKRLRAIHLLQSFSIFRNQYLSIHGENDFPNNRFIFCAPELSFPVFSAIAMQWNDSQHAQRFGRVSVYPVARMSPPVHDSIINFWEMWDSGRPAIGRGILNGIEAEFYLEINEDFNLNLKLDIEELEKSIRDEVWKRLENIRWPSFVNLYPRQYKQGTYVLYEFDFGFLAELNNLGKAVNNLGDTVDIIIEALA